MPKSNICVEGICNSRSPRNYVVFSLLPLKIVFNNASSIKIHYFLSEIHLLDLVLFYNPEYPLKLQVYYVKLPIVLGFRLSCNNKRLSHKGLNSNFISLIVNSPERSSPSWLVWLCFPRSFRNLVSHLILLHHTLGCCSCLFCQSWIILCPQSN